MQKSIFTKYFSVCASLILVSIGILGSALMLFASGYFKTEKYELLQTNVVKAVDKVEANIDEDNRILMGKPQSYFDLLADAIGADFFLVDTDGRTAYCTEEYPCRHTTYQLTDTILAAMQTDGEYKEIGTLGGIYTSHSFTVGAPVYGSSGDLVGYVLASMNSTESMQNFLIEVFKMFAISALVVLVLVCIIIYFVTHSMVRPLREMSEAAQKFGNGDFSTRLTVYSYDEVGQLAMALNNMAQSLSTLETMRRSFISNVSHELKTPMTTIGGFIDGILDGTIPPEKQKQYLRIVSDEVKRLSRIVRSMLNLSQIEAGEMKLNRHTFDMVDTICQTLFSLERQIDDKKLEIRGLDHDKVFVDADEDLIHQVVYNLTENAIKFANTGGYIEFEFLKEGGRQMIGVKNSGEGLSKEEIPRVFDRFYKTDRSRGQDKSGVGLGLYIVRSIVTLHGGDIIVKSVQGEYCEFLFTLPPGKPKTQNKFKKNS
ncbi:HAMP domain-containing histidine kinase [Massiliimalia massiliensis]|uniref:HAMP domain-containing histidine kinase n=1 Tax=Massiliimalia massiliensis TaxID=1852384 RepID=UPI00098717C9|nr:HAMP domain-containing histidine kinase [Massiliimalia massiliensis]